MPSPTPADFSADMALGGSGHADTIYSYPTRAACFADLRDHAVRLMKRRDRHGLRRCCDGQGKSSNSDQSDHVSLPYVSARFVHRGDVAGARRFRVVMLTYSLHLLFSWHRFTGPTV
jgi:hypothetical protein